MLDKVFNEDCLEGMKRIPDGSIDMILCDLPYGTTACKWDTIIPFDKLWEQYLRVIKDNGAIVLFGSEPFSTKLRSSMLDLYRYDWIWVKPHGSGFFNANKMPLKSHEVISVFYKNPPTYNPQMAKGKPYKAKRGYVGEYLSSTERGAEWITENEGYRYPVSTLKYNIDTGLHPTQKPTALLSYLIRTYTNEGETVLDNCMGSGGTAIACLHTKRHFIGFELEREYFGITQDRIARYLKINGKETIEDCYK